MFDPTRLVLDFFNYLLVKWNNIRVHVVAHVISIIGYIRKK